MNEETELTHISILFEKKEPKKQLAVYLDDEMLEQMDVIVKFCSSMNDSKSLSKNMVVEEALRKYIKDFDKYIAKEHGFNLQTLINEERKNYDTVLMASNGRGFEAAFLGEDEEEMCWYPCRISDEREKNLRYIAIYRGSPISAITHYAEIKEFKYSEEKNCKVCYFVGDPIELPNPVTLGNKNNRFFVGVKYTKLDSLKRAKIADDIQF